MNEGWFAKIRGQPPQWARFILGLVPVAILFGVWHYMTVGEVEERRVHPVILPSPAEVWETVPALRDRDILTNTWLSFRRVGIAYGIAVGLVLPLGVLMGAFGSIRAMFNPAMTASGYVPIATLLPLTVAWFGTGEKMRVAFLALAFAIFLLPLIVKAIDAVPEVYLRTAYTLGATRWQAIWNVLVPVALPDIWYAMRLAFGVGWTYLVLAEVFVLEGGLGALVEVSRRRQPREHIYLIIVLITVIAWVVDLAWDHGGRLLFGKRGRAEA
ncbi:MAG: ABC transporter permease subunit [Planctomycetota bacterium]|nr:ABC transporter permease subunit [Planctomycetota bacterium]